MGLSQKPQEKKLEGESTQGEQSERSTRKPGPREQVWTAQATPPRDRKFSTPGPAARIEYSLGNWGPGKTLPAVARQHRPWVERAQGCG